MGKIADVQEVTLTKLVPYVNNAKIHSEEQVTMIASSIREFGFLSPVLIDRDFNIIAGHGRVMAAKKLEMDAVPCVFVEGLTEAQRKAYILADNRLGELADWNMDLVNMELEALNDMDFDISLTGFDMPEIEIEEAEIVEDEVPEEVETRCKLGDIWQLGDHRLICGDSTDVDVIDELMDGQKADMVFTDPPYNVNMRRSAQIQNDDISDSDFIELLSSSFINAKSYCKGSMYWWIGFRQYSTLEEIIKDNGFDIANCIVWDKGSIGLGGNGYRYQHELCIFVGKINNKRESDVWQFNRSSEGLHPTMKPIALIVYAMKNIDNVKSVLDVFGGSGSTLIACEQTGRKCYMCELDEHYCDVIIQRWENYTGKKAELVEKP